MKLTYICIKSCFLHKHKITYISVLLTCNKLYKKNIVKNKYFVKTCKFYLYLNDNKLRIYVDRTNDSTRRYQNLQPKICKKRFSFESEKAMV